MAEFDPAITLTLQHEGGYVNNPEDRGGATNMGIEQRDMPSLVDIRYLTVAQAKDYYRAKFWQPWMAEIENQDVCNKIFDMGVLLGVETAVRLLQRSLTFAKREQDGVCGPVTLDAISRFDPALLLARYRAVLVAHFKWIVQQDPNQQEFLAGWENRINS